VAQRPEINLKLKNNSFGKTSYQGSFFEAAPSISSLWGKGDDGQVTEAVSVATSKGNKFYKK